MSGPAPGGSATLERFREYQRTGDRRLRNELVEQYLQVADHYAARYASRGVPVEDLRQTALLAMIRAVDRFDPEAGVEFSTFASRTVDGELKRWFRDRAWAVRPPRAAQERHLALRRFEDELTQRLGRSPTVEELGEVLGESVDHVLEALEAGAARTATTLARPVPGEDVNSGEEVLPTDDVGFGRVDQRLLVGELLDRLPERDRTVIELRFFEQLGQEQIAQRIGVSQSYLSRLLRRILLDLRGMLDAPSD